MQQPEIMEKKQRVKTSKGHKSSGSLLLLVLPSQNYLLTHSPRLKTPCSLKNIQSRSDQTGRRQSCMWENKHTEGDFTWLLCKDNLACISRPKVIQHTSSAHLPAHHSDQ